MATTPVSKDFEVSSSERADVVRALQTLRASVSRSLNTERDEDVKRIREAELVRLDALVLRFR